MPIKSNVTDRRSRREKYKTEITLISGGFASPDAFPGGKITVYPWDSSVDAWLTDTASKAVGTERERLLYDLMSKVCNLNGCPLEEFVLGDVNTVLMVSRSLASKAVIHYVTVCPKCSHESTEKVQVPDELKSIGQKVSGYPGTDLITLKECGDNVEIRPLRIRDELAISTRTIEERQRINNHVAHLIAPVVSVNGGQPDRIDEILEWYSALPLTDAQQLEEAIDQLTPHLSQELLHKCDDCGHVYTHRLVMDQEFFRSGRMGTPRGTVAANI